MVTCVRVCSHNRLILLIMFLQFIFMIESYIPFVYLFTSVCFDLITLSMVYNKVIRQIERKREKTKSEGGIRWLSFIFLWMNCIFIDGVLARRLDFWYIARSDGKHKNCYVSTYLMRYKNVQAIFQYFNSWMNFVRQMTWIKWSFRGIC